jgi:hypothetical protein
MIMTWRKSSRSETQNCVEVRGDLKAIRDSKSPGLIMPVDKVAVSRLVARIRAEH